MLNMNSTVIFVFFLIYLCSVQCLPINNEAESDEIEDLLSTTTIKTSDKKHTPRIAIPSSLPDDVEWIRPTTMQEQTFRPVDSLFQLIFAVCKSTEIGIK